MTKRKPRKASVAKKPKATRKRKAIRLDIGAGTHCKDGWTPIDANVGKNAYPLTDYADNSVEEVHASHILEHFSYAEVQKVLTEWVRVLKPNGRIQIAVPNFAYIAKAYDQHAIAPKLLFGYAMGGQTDNLDFHKTAWDKALLRRLMMACGLDRIAEWESTGKDCAALPVSLNLEGYKRPPRDTVVIPKTSAVMSMGRLTFAENMFCAVGIFPPRNIKLSKYTGAFWGQCLERLLMEDMEKGAEWIITLDYDTVFTDDQLDYMLYLMATHPEVDALTPWQCKRECDFPLATMTDENGQKREMVSIKEIDAQELIKVYTAHFGLTIIRASALAKMKHPWFHGQPNEAGDWGDGRLDDDISFWHNFSAAGNQLYLASHIAIGHMQQVITWPDDKMIPRHQYMTDFQKEGIPSWARR